MQTLPEIVKYFYYIYIITVQKIPIIVSNFLLLIFFKANWHTYEKIHKMI